MRAVATSLAAVRAFVLPIPPASSFPAPRPGWRARRAHAASTAPCACERKVCCSLRTGRRRDMGSRLEPYSRGRHVLQPLIPERRPCPPDLDWVLVDAPPCPASALTA